MRKSVKSLITAILMVFTFCGFAMAEEGRFGLGVMLGEPTGINAKYFIDKSNAIDGAIGWSLDGGHDFHLHGDYLYHIYSLIDSERAEIPIFAGVGARVVFRDNKDNKAGIRFPLGLDSIFRSAPFDVFAEIVPVLDLAPDTDFDLEGAIGARFFF